jgi:folate-binding protein YgfZ
MSSVDEAPVCLAVTGEDRVEFLQGQLTQDVARLADERMLSGAWCNPKGRVVALVTLVHDQERICLFVPAWQAEGFAERLLRYRLRADVDLVPDEETWLVAIDCGPGGVTLPEGAPVLATRILRGTEPRVMEICTSAGDLGAFGPAVLLDRQALALASVRAGRPSLHPDTVESFTPHMLNLDLLDAVSFRKGCYTGQEVVARTENLGRPSRRMLRFTASAAPPAPGDRLLDEAGDTAGTVVRTAARGAETELLAVASLKRLGGRITLEGGETVTEQALPYAVPELAPV